MGDLHRIIKSRNKKFGDPDFEFLLRIDPKNLSHNLSPFFKRPAYGGTKVAVGEIK